MTRAILCLLGNCLLFSCSAEENSAPEISNLSDEARVCLYGAESMIDLARQAVNDTNSRAQRRESRRVLMEDWISRLNAGEDPCAVYEDIFRESTTF